MNIVKDGHPFIFAFAIITFAVGYWGSLIWAVVPAVLMLFFIYFFRIPIVLHNQMTLLFILLQMEQ